MPDPKSLQTNLRTRLRRFLASRSPAAEPLLNGLARLAARGWRTAVVGGLPRHLALPFRTGRLRDVDLVVEGVDLDGLHSAFDDFVTGRTRFGGLILNIGGWRVDIWPLHETWGFRAGLVSEATLENLPRTTFLNIDSLAVDLWAPPRGVRRIYDNGFFEGAIERVVEINLEENPRPASSVAQALAIASKLGFAIGPKLVRFVARHEKELNWEAAAISDLRQANDLMIARWLDEIRSYSRRNRSEPLAVPPMRWKQASFWDEDPLILATPTDPVLG